MNGSVTLPTGHTMIDIDAEEPRVIQIHSRRSCCPACGGEERYDAPYVGGRGHVPSHICVDCGHRRELRGLEDYR